MDVDEALRLKGTLEGAAAIPGPRAGRGHAASYPRIRAQVASAIDRELVEEMDRLFPEQLSTTGQPWGVQAEEAVVLMNQLAGWLGGIIESAILEQRIQVEAAERAKRTGFA